MREALETADRAGAGRPYPESLRRAAVEHHREREREGASARAVAAELGARSASTMKGSTMLATLQRLGVIASFSRPSVSDDNPFAEALFRTLKYRPGYPRKPFSNIDAARAWVEGFVTWYNGSTCTAASGE